MLLEKLKGLAMTQSNIIYHQQGIFDLRSKQLVAHELLLRCIDTFDIRKINESRKMYVSHLTALVHAKLQQINELQSLSKETVIFINFSPEQVASRQFEKCLLMISEAISERHRLAIEVTEQTNLLQNDVIVRNLKLARSLGFFVAIDDFGSGYSNLLQIIRIKPDIVKIDRELLEGAVGGTFNSEGLRMLANLTRFLKSLSFKVVIEGIETERHLDFALEAGADFGQGYYLQRPCPINESKLTATHALKQQARICKDCI